MHGYYSQSGSDVSFQTLTHNYAPFIISSIWSLRHKHSGWISREPVRIRIYTLIFLFPVMPQKCKYQNSLTEMTTYKIQECPQHHHLLEKTCRFVLPPFPYNVGNILLSNDRWEQKVISYSLNSSARSNTQIIKTRRLMRLLLATAESKQIKQVTDIWNVVCKLHCSCRMDTAQASL
jgi:hypothetical protein